MTKNTFTKRHEGEAVVYSHPDGGSVSAIVTRVEPDNCVQLRFAVPYNGHRVAIVPRNAFHQLTRFGNSMFFVSRAACS